MQGCHECGRFWVHYAELVFHNRGVPNIRAGGPMQRVHRRGSQVMSECCKVGYSATLARAHVHNFTCSENRGFPSLGDLCREVI